MNYENNIALTANIVAYDIGQNFNESKGQSEMEIKLIINSKDNRVLKHDVVLNEINNFLQEKNEDRWL